MYYSITKNRTRITCARRVQATGILYHLHRFNMADNKQPVEAFTLEKVGRDWDLKTIRGEYRGRYKTIHCACDSLIPVQEQVA